MEALILVDVQNDFVPSGALAVPAGNEVVPVANRLMTSFELVFATQDWHPANHGSFASQHPGRVVGDVVDLNGLEQHLWPDHCVQGTPGAAFIDSLDTSRLTGIIRKGMDPGVDSYSGFFDNGHRQATGLGEALTERGVRDVYLVGLATDYCVKFTALDAAKLGFRTSLVPEGVRGVEVQAGDCERSIEEIRAAGVSMVHAETVMQRQQRPL